MSKDTSTDISSDTKTNVTPAAEPNASEEQINTDSGEAKEMNPILEEEVKEKLKEEVITPTPEKGANPGTSYDEFNHNLQKLSNINEQTNPVSERETQPDTSGTETHTHSEEVSKPCTNGEKVNPIPKKVTKPGFPLLPDEMWLEVFKLLPIRDRISVSLVCKQLQRVFTYNALWKSLTFTTEQRCRETHLEEMACLKRHDRYVLEKCGHCIANLTIVTLKFVFEYHSYSSILSLMTHNELKTFTIHMTHTPLYGIELFREEVNGLPTVETLISNVRRDLPNCEVNIDYRQMDFLDKFYTNIFRGSPSELCCRHLRTLKLFHNCLWSSEETLRPPVRDASSPTAVVVSRFPHLEHLTIMKSNLSDQLLKTLSEMSEANGLLRTLNVILNKYDHEVASSAAWGRLVRACPDLQVSCYSVPDHNDLCDHMRGFFKPEIPLKGIHLQCHFFHNELDQFLSVCDTFSHTLETIECLPTFGFIPNCARLFISTVDRCPNLRDLHLGGGIEGEVVQTLASIKRNWRSFTITGDVAKRTEACGTEGESFRLLTSSEISDLERAVTDRLGYPRPWKVCPQRPAHLSLVHDVLTF